MSGLIVCATQRSGSTLLCELLKATGVAGIPNQHFQHFKGTGLADQPRRYLNAPYEPPDAAEFVIRSESTEESALRLVEAVS
jgi:LPS sulfotransferase NodH